MWECRVHHVGACLIRRLGEWALIIHCADVNVDILLMLAKVCMGSAQLTTPAADMIA